MSIAALPTTPKRNSANNLVDSDDVTNNGNGEMAVKGSELIEIREFKKR